MGIRDKVRFVAKRFAQAQERMHRALVVQSFALKSPLNTFHVMGTDIWCTTVANRVVLIPKLERLIVGGDQMLEPIELLAPTAVYTAADTQKG